MRIKVKLRICLFGHVNVQFTVVESWQIFWFPSLPYIEIHIFYICWNSFPSFGPIIDEGSFQIGTVIDFQESSICHGSWFHAASSDCSFVLIPKLFQCGRRIPPFYLTGFLYYFLCYGSKFSKILRSGLKYHFWLRSQATLRGTIHSTNQIWLYKISKYSIWLNFSL